MSFQDPRTRELPFAGSLTRAAYYHAERIGSAAEPLLEWLRGEFYSPTCHSLACLTYDQRVRAIGMLANVEYKGPPKKAAPPKQPKPQSQQEAARAVPNAKLIGIECYSDHAIVTLRISPSEIANYLQA